MNSMQILQYELGNFKAISADVLINPDLSDFTWIEYYRADELIARGAEAAQKALPLIEQAVTTILISETTYAAVQSAFECRQMPDTQLRGKTKDLKIYEVVSMKAAAAV